MGLPGKGWKVGVQDLDRDALGTQSELVPCGCLSQGASPLGEGETPELGMLGRADPRRVDWAATGAGRVPSEAGTPHLPVPTVARQDVKPAARMRSHGLRPAQRGARSHGRARRTAPPSRASEASPKEKDPSARRPRAPLASQG